MSKFEIALAGVPKPKGGISVFENLNKPEITRWKINEEEYSSSISVLETSFFISQKKKGEIFTISKKMTFELLCFPSKLK